MSDTVLDVLLYLFETYTEQEPEAADQDVLRDELLRAGFGEPEVDSALDWLDGLNETSAPYAGVPGERSVRVYNEVEIRRLDLDCRGYLLYLEQVGILSAAQREVVIDLPRPRPQEDLYDARFVELTRVLREALR